MATQHSIAQLAHSSHNVVLTTAEARQGLALVLAAASDAMFMAQRRAAA